MNQEPPEGFHIGFHSSLSEPIAIAGVPRMVAIVNGTLAAIICLGLQVPWLGAPLAVAVHGVAYWLASSDPHVFDVLTRHLKQHPYLDA